jgi:hypothetical protein
VSELKDFINSKEIALYLKELPQEDTIDQALFPTKKQMSTSIEFAKGSKKKAVVLRQSAFDTAAKVRALSAELSVFKKEMPFFKEAIGINETIRRDLINAMNANNQNLVDALIEQVFENYAVLREGARIAMKRMRTQLIQNGEINITSADGDVVVDYGVPSNHKITISTGKWNTAAADIVGDIAKYQKLMVKEHYAKPNIMLMTEATFDATFMINTAIKGAILSGYNTNFPILGQKHYLDYVKEVCGVTIVFLEDSVYYDEDGGEPIPYYEDKKITFMSGSTLGNTVYGVTPEEYDKTYGSGKLDTSMVDNIAITTMVKEDPVSVDTKVSMIGIPSFERADEVLFITAY